MRCASCARNGENTNRACAAHRASRAALRHARRARAAMLPLSRGSQATYRRRRRRADHHRIIHATSLCVSGEGNHIVHRRVQRLWQAADGAAAGGGGSALIAPQPCSVARDGMGGRQRIVSRIGWHGVAAQRALTSASRHQYRGARKQNALAQRARNARCAVSVARQTDVRRARSRVSARRAYARMRQRAIALPAAGVSKRTPQNSWRSKARRNGGGAKATASDGGSAAAASGIFVNNQRAAKNNQSGSGGGWKA